MAKEKRQFVCQSCGYVATKWMGQCPSCQEWNQFEERDAPKASSGKKHRVEISEDRHNALESVRLADIPDEDRERITTGMDELDRVLGGGLVPASLILLGGDPGIGKSTLMLQLAKTSPTLKILYVAGEESAHQIRQRASRLHLTGKEDLRILTETELDRVIVHVRKERPDLVVVDSIQTVYRSTVSSLPGSTQQVRECAALLQQLAKREGVTTLMIGHVTKEGEIAGPRVLEHMVDTVLQFEGDPSRLHRLLRGVKNRFGPAHEVGVFEMRGDGLQEVLNPSELFLSELDESVSGNAVTCLMEGSRPLLTEVQALVAPSTYGTPQRTTSGFDQRRLSLLLAVLERRAGIPFSSHDVYLNVAGGLTIQDRVADLAVLAALASSFRDTSVPEKALFLGEVGLGGEIRMVPQLDVRLREAEKMGFRQAYVPGRTGKVSSELALRSHSYIQPFVRALFSNEKS
ncbi:MAG: DNA repair protein RadA [Bacteroidota bacterium]